MAALQTYSLTTDSSAALNPLKLDHPIIIPLGQLIINDSVTAYIGVPNVDTNAVTLDKLALRLH